jgi:hypothetical protein
MPRDTHDMPGPTVDRTPRGYCIWRGFPVDRGDLPSLRKSVSDWTALEPYAPDIKRDNDHTRAVIRELEQDHVHA